MSSSFFCKAYNKCVYEYKCTIGIFPKKGVLPLLLRSRMIVNHILQVCFQQLFINKTNEFCCCQCCHFLTVIFSPTCYCCCCRLCCGCGWCRLLLLFLLIMVNLRSCWLFAFVLLMLLFCLQYISDSQLILFPPI